MRLRKMKWTGALTAVIVVSIVLLGGLACGDGATKDITVTSSTVHNHSHNVTISGANVDDPPSGKTLTTTEDGAVPHTHTITLSKQDYEAIKEGQEVTVASSAFPGDNHTHTFVIKE